MSYQCVNHVSVAICKGTDHLKYLYLSTTLVGIDDLKPLY